MKRMSGWCGRLAVALACGVAVGGVRAADYMVVDVSGGPSASNYPVRYLTAAPAGGWTDEDKTAKIVLRRIPAGAFTMGSPTNEFGRGLPVQVFPETQHQVALSHDFYIGVFDVTQKQWERVMGDWPSHFRNASYRDTRPVEQVTYERIRGADLGTKWPAANSVDATSFMGRLRARTGIAFDLPTESQWEYAGRAGATTALNTGYNLTNTDQDAHLDETGRYSHNGGNVRWPNRDADTSVGTAKVGSYLPNAWGLYDMHGNVWEWCLDWYGAYPGSVRDPKGPSSGWTRVLRGGGWFYLRASGCRMAFRDDYLPDEGGSNIGFRLVAPASAGDVR